MRASGLVVWGSLSALAFTSATGGCGGRADVGVPDAGGGDGASSGSSSGVSGSSSGFSGSSSGFSGSSSGIDGGGSGSSSGIDGGGSGSSSGVSGSSSGFSGSSSGVSSSSSGGAYSYIELEECLTSLCASQNFQVYAQFGTGNGNSGCTGATTGACTYYSCSGAMTGPGVSAGTLTVSSPWLTTPVSIPYGGTLYQYTSSTPGFNAGQTVTVTASGASVPAFGPVSVAAPDLAELVQPPVTIDGGVTNIPTASDLVVQWTGGQPGATMILEAFENTNPSNYTFCTWNGSDGKGIVPAAALKPFSGTTGAFYWGQYNLTSFSAGPYPITLTALPFAAGNVSFQ